MNRIKKTLKIALTSIGTATLFVNMAIPCETCVGPLYNEGGYPFGWFYGCGQSTFGAASCTPPEQYIVYCQLDGVCS